MLPLGQVSRLMLGSHFTVTWLLRATLTIPLAPSTMMLRASSMLAPTSAIRTFLPRASPCTHSDPARVLPYPRPASISHTRQPSPGGVRCPSLAHISKSASSDSSTAGDKSASNAR